MNAVPALAIASTSGCDTNCERNQSDTPTGPAANPPGRRSTGQTEGTLLASMRELACCPNVTVKLGGILMSLANFDFRGADRPPTSDEVGGLWRPYIEPCLEMFGADRCMVSSNFPVDKAGFGYGTVWNMFKRIVGGSSSDERAVIFDGTARRPYRT